MLLPLYLVFGSLITVVLLAIPRSLDIFANYSMNYVEGWNAYYDSIAASGEPLYANVLASPNYPPLSFYIVGILGSYLGSVVTFGRVLSLVSLFGVSVGVYQILKIFSGSARLATVGLLWTLGLFLVFAPDYIGMNSPQFLAHILMMASMLLYIKFRLNPASGEKMLIAVAFFALTSLYIKHNLIAFPIAVSLDLLMISKRRFLAWCVVFFGIGGLILFLLDYETHGRFLEALLVKRDYDILKMIHRLRFSVAVLIIPFICSLSTVSKFLHAGPWRWLGFYYVSALVVGIASYGGAGIDVNLLFDFVIALGILLPIGALERSPRFIRPGVLLFFLLGIVFRFVTMPSLDSIHAKEAAYKKDVDYLSSIAGTAICEDLLLCYWAKKPLVFEPWLVRQEMENKQLDEDEILNAIQNKTWAVVEIDRPEVANRFSESFLETLRTNYKRAEQTENATRSFYIRD